MSNSTRRGFLGTCLAVLAAPLATCRALARTSASATGLLFAPVNFDEALKSPVIYGLPIYVTVDLPRRYRKGKIVSEVPSQSTEVQMWLHLVTPRSTAGGSLRIPQEREQNDVERAGEEG